MIINIIDILIQSLLTIVPLFLAVAIFTLMERKVMGAIQRRRGPSILGFWGILQPIADGLKLVIKEIVIPIKSNRFLFVLSPILTLLLSLISWAVIPFSFSNVIANVNLSLLYILVVSSLGVYGILISGWASNSKYAFLGSLRSLAQMISYEIILGLLILPPLLFSGSLNLITMVWRQWCSTWYILPLWPLGIIFFICILAETNRAPFDLPEAEAEIVAGYNLEYASIIFALFFLGEYSNMIIMSSFFIILFLGGWLPPMFFKWLHLPFEFWFSVKLIIVGLFFIFVRANYPRVRYDQLMDLCWKCFLPFTTAYFLFASSIVYIYKGLPNTIVSL